MRPFEMSKSNIDLKFLRQSVNVWNSADRELCVEILKYMFSTIRCKKCVF